MELSITRALSELKLLNDRILRKASEGVYIAGAKKSSKKINNIYSREEFNEKVKSDYQSITALIERRKRIKSAIVSSNSQTKITISNKEMTVAEAIERKDSIEYDKCLLREMSNQFNAVLSNISRQNEMVNANLENLLNTSFGKERTGKVDESEILAISKPYLEQNEWEVIDVLALKTKIEDLKTSIEDFESEIDFTLSESNAITKITIED